MEMLFGTPQLSAQERRRRLGGGSGKRTVELMPIRPAAPVLSNPEVQVSEEELEALLKEFLAT